MAGWWKGHRIGLRTGLGAGLRFAATWLALTARSGATPRDEDLFMRPEDVRAVLFGTLDTGRSTFMSWGAKVALVGPLDRSGPIVVDTAGFGLDRERARVGEANLPARRLTVQGRSMVGWQWSQPGLFLSLVAGPEVETEQLDVAGRVYRVSKPRLGLRVEGELWSNPSPDTLFTGSVGLSSTNGSLWTRGSAGYRAWGSVYLGPETVLYVTDTYREWKWGAHLTDATVGLIHLRVSGGVASASDRSRLSPYMSVSAWIRL